MPRHRSSNRGTVLVTGGLGFLGRHVVAGLLNEGYAVKVGDLPGGETRLGELSGRVDWQALDITRPASCAMAVQGCDAVVHLAALVSDVAPWANFRRVTVEGTRNMVSASAAAGLGRFVQVSSVAVHAFANREYADETTPRDASLWYGLAKAKAEEEVEKGSRESGLKSTIVRPGLVPYGPGDLLTMPRLVEGMRKGLVPLVDEGRGLICTAWAPDFGVAVARLVDRKEAEDEVFILADQEPLTWRTWFETIAEVFNAPAPKLVVPGGLARGLGAVVEDAWGVLSPGKLPPLSRYRGQLLSNSHHFSPEKAKSVLGINMKCRLRDGLEEIRERLGRLPD